jgi:hypothetical protein
MLSLEEHLENIKNIKKRENSLCTVVNQKKDAYDIYIGRPTKWGNPFTHKKNTLGKYVVNDREDAIEEYFNWITEGEGKYLLKDLSELKGKILGCWCKPLPCHGDILAQLIKEKYYDNNK